VCLASSSFFRNSDSVVTVRRLFRRKFNVERRGVIPDRNCDGLKHLEISYLSIRQEIAAVPQKMLKRAMQDFEQRLRMCVRQEGRHLTLFSVRNLVRTLKMH